MATGTLQGVVGLVRDDVSPHVQPGAEVGALRMAAARGTPAAGWPASVGCNREEVTVAEIKEAEELQEDCRDAAEAALCSLGGDVFGLRVVTLDRVRRPHGGGRGPGVATATW